MLDKLDNISIRKQSDLLDVGRSYLYYKPVIYDDSEIVNKIKEVYLESDCRYGYRKITEELNNLDYQINHKKVLKIMNSIGIEGVYPKKKTNTTIANPLHKVYPYLLGNLTISYPNQVWATDITYIKIPDKFMYFVAIIDLYSRYIIAYDLSASLEAISCISTLKESLKKNKPEIFNTDQGSQFTSKDFTSILLENDIKISMDHKGRCFDNIFVERLWRTLKQESIYYYRPGNIRELEKCINDFVPWYNNDRIHQSLNYKTPKYIYNAGRILLN